jgi:hypothetical protein
MIMHLTPARTQNGAIVLRKECFGLGLKNSNEKIRWAAFGRETMDEQGVDIHQNRHYPVWLTNSRPRLSCSQAGSQRRKRPMTTNSWPLGLTEFDPDTRGFQRDNLLQWVQKGLHLVATSDPECQWQKVDHEIFPSRFWRQPSQVDERVSNPFLVVQASTNHKE